MDSALKIRAFLALPLTPLFQSDVAPLLEKLKRDNPEIRWVSPSEIHVTFHFFGMIAPKEVSKISGIVAPVVKQSKTFEICLDGLGAFPNPARPRVIWLGIKGGTAPLVALQRRIEERLRSEGFACEDREFRPHLTLGRIKGGRFSGLDRVEFKPTPSKKVTEIVLFQSHLTPQEAHYEAIATYPLSSS